MTTHHTLPADATPAEAPPERTVRGGFFSNEDWWAVWIGLAVIVVAWGLFAGGHSIKWLAVAPAKWTSLAQAGADFTKHWSNYVALFVVLAALFSVSIVALRQRLAHFLPSFLILFIASRCL